MPGFRLINSDGKRLLHSDGKRRIYDPTITGATYCCCSSSSSSTSSSSSSGCCTFAAVQVAISGTDTATGCNNCGPNAIDWTGARSMDGTFCLAHIGAFGMAECVYIYCEAQPTFPLWLATVCSGAEPEGVVEAIFLEIQLSYYPIPIFYSPAGWYLDVAYYGQNFSAYNSSTTCTGVLTFTNSITS